MHLEGQQEGRADISMSTDWELSRGWHNRVKVPVLPISKKIDDQEQTLVLPCSTKKAREAEPVGPIYGKGMSNAGPKS